MIPKARFSFRVVAATALLVGLPATAAQSGAPVNFSGTWRLDAEASEINSAEGMYGLGGSAPENLYVTQARNGALILSSRVNGAQPRNYIIGGENALPAPGGEAARMTMASRWDGASLVNEGTGEFEGAPVRVREVLSLEDDGATLRIVVVTAVAGERARNTLVYRKAAR